MKILITGSRGIVGSVITSVLKEEHTVKELDIKHPTNPIDILKEDLSPYFSEIETVIHLAANPNPAIGAKEALKNFKIGNRVLKACSNYSNIERIINASSLNVYPFIEMYKKDERITRETILSPNTTWSNGEYGLAKIASEKIFEEYCKRRGVSLLNLRLGGVTKDDLPFKQSDGSIEQVDREIHLYHKDLISIIKKGLEYRGKANYVCISKRNGFVAENINFPL